MKVEKKAEFLQEWLQKVIERTGSRGVVLGLSGGLDSAVVAALAVRALPGRCLGIIMPCHSAAQDMEHAVEVAEKIGLPYKTIVLDQAFDQLYSLYTRDQPPPPERERLLRGNIKARLRMVTLYYQAQLHDYLVVGTGNKSEITVGYSTKYGDHGVDLQLLGDLVKQEVYELAVYLELPPSVINKAPSGGLWDGQTDEEELGFTYAELDSYLLTGEGDKKTVERIRRMHRASEHKRCMPPVALLPRRQ
ncbi:MAG: NAD(+) synthase [Syntrophomonadaceae bacterium]|nr:NAD(+) synthase [Syntrophomonadaceae bacterium]